MFGIDDIMLGATVAGAATSIFGMEGKRKAQKTVLADEIAQEENRRQQMEVDNLRSNRQLIRNAQMTRAVATSNQSQSGAIFGSAAGGAAGQTQGQQGVAGNALFQNLQFGERSFDLSEKLARDKAKVGKYQGIESLGGSIMGMAGGLGRMFGGRGGGGGNDTGGGVEGDSGDF